MTLQSILLKYWGFSTFRPMQEDIIRSAIEGRDTLALLPTGGGKSLCYQVPGMAMDGLCIVITPLIALMKDQVQALRDKGINATCIYHGLSQVEIEHTLNNCAFGNVKFLYMSPERLVTEGMQSRLRQMKVNLMAIDEAHCISQWGYDFRPPYLQIAEARELIPGTPLLALTATATPEVVQDIQDKLGFVNGKVFQKSFERKNLAYHVVKEEDKLGRLLKICQQIQGTGVVYVRNRKRTRDIAEHLIRNRIAADYYHAGLTTKERDEKQERWMREKVRVIVSTNAFGMGIDKPNVRFVVHMDLPDSPEAYFQEAGRGGRDGKKAYAILLFNEADVADLERFHEQSFPPIKDIKKVYNCLGNHFQLAVGSGKNQSMAFEMVDFSKKYALNPLLVFNALVFLEREGLLARSDALANPSRLMFTVDNETLYKFLVANPKYDAFIKHILRSYTGLFSTFTKIREDELAKRASIPKEEVIKKLQALHGMQILQYKMQNEKPLITLLEGRKGPGELVISKSIYHDRKVFARQRMKAMIAYVSRTIECRSRFLLNYFGETNSQRCGQCDGCLEQNKAGVSSYEFEQISKSLQSVLQDEAKSIRQIIGEINLSLSETKIIGVVRYLADNGRISEDKNGNLKWTP